MSDSRLISIDEISLSKSDDRRPIVFTDFDGVLHLIRTSRESGPWKTYVELDELSPELSVDPVRNLAALPVEVIGLSTRGPAMLDILRANLEAIGEIAPQWRVLDVVPTTGEMHRPRLANAGPPRSRPRPLMPLDVPLIEPVKLLPLHPDAEGWRREWHAVEGGHRNSFQFKPFTLTALLEQRRKLPELERRSFIWFDDEASREVVENLQMLAPDLYAPDISASIGLTPSHLRDVAWICRNDGLFVPRNFPTGVSTERSL